MKNDTNNLQHYSGPRSGSLTHTTDGRNQAIYWKEFNDHYYLDAGGCAWCGGADISRSGNVDWSDFAELAGRWLDDDCGPTCD